MNSFKSNQRLSGIAMALFIVFILVSQTPANAQIAYTDNNVDTDSNQDSISNKGASGSTNYLDAQTFDASNETIFEKDTGRGITQINEDWTNYKYINIDHYQVTDDLTDFPVLVSIFDEDIKRNAQIDGDDIAFFDISGTQLSHEIETYDPNYNTTHAQLIAWVKSNLSSSKDTRLTMKYGNSTMNSQSNSTGVWSSDYTGVWHLSENPPTNISDSTSNSNDGTGSGSLAANSSQISKGTKFTDTVGQEISIPNSASLTISDTLTISAWIHPETIGDWYTIVSKVDGAIDSRVSTLEDLYIAVDFSGDFYIRLSSSSSSVEWVTPFTSITGAWQYVTFSYNSTTSIGSFYLNGQLLGTNNFGLGLLKTNTNPFYIGYNRVWISEVFNGVIDEVKVSNIVKSTNWIKTEFNNQNNTNLFYSVTNEFYYNNPWKYYKQISINNSKVSADVNDFPVYFSIIDEDLKTKAQTDGDDIAFFEKSGSQLAHELITYDPNYSITEAKLVAWVKADLSSSVDTIITMKYGDPTLTSQENPTAVWTNNYNNVWHLEEDPSISAPQIVDTTLSNPGTSFGLMTSNDQVSGKLDGSLDFDGQPQPFGDQINVGQIESNSWSALTMSAWVYKHDTGDDRVFSVAQNTGVNETIFALLMTPTQFQVKIGTDGTGGSNSSSVSGSGYATNTWYHFAATWDSVTEMIYIYVNGVQVGSAAKDGDSIKDTSEAGLIGNVAVGYDRYYNGTIDEVRLSNFARSVGWIGTEYNNQNDPNTFYSIGSELSLDLSDPSTSLIRNFEDPVDNIISNLDGSDNHGTHSNFNSEQDKDNIFDTLSESAPNTHSIDSTGDGYMLVGGGSADWRSSQGTISFWVRYATLTGARSWGLGGSMEFKSQDADSIKFDWGGGNTLISTTNLVSNKWYFFALTWNDQTNTLIFYIGDENTVPTVDVSTTSWIDSVVGTAMTTNTFLASEGKTGSQVNGSGDELRYWDTDRNITDIQNDYNKILKGTESNLRSYYRLDNNFIDIGSDGNDGVASGTLPFSNIEKPNFNSKLDLEAQFLSVPLDSVVELAIYTGTLATEEILVDFWNGASWTNLKSNLNSNSWNNISVSNFVTSNIFTIRFRDGNRSLDSNQDSWQIDVVLLIYTNYQLEWEHQVQSVDLTKENYLLTVYGSSSDTSEGFEIQMWDSIATDWTTSFVITIGNTEQWYNYTLTDPNVIGSTITWRYRGDNETKDNIQNTLYIDYAGIASFDEAPVFDVTPNNLQYDEGSTSNTLEWDLSDDNPNRYTIFRDEVNITSNNWTNPSPISINVDGLLKGVYTYKIMATDTKGHHANDTVLVTVVDGTDPLITFTLGNYNYIEGVVGNQLNWTASDNYFDNYEIYNDTNLVQSGSWSTGINITLNIDGLLKGVYNFTLNVFDTTGNSASDIVQVTIIDLTPPEINHPSDITYSAGSSGNDIIWLATDSNAGSYQIWNATDLIKSDVWTSNVNITYNVDGLVKGVYNFTIIVFDSSGNSSFDIVMVTVTDETPPILINNPSDTQYSEGDIGNTLTWNATDTSPANYEIYIDGQINETASWLSGVNITINIDGLLKGVHNITIVIFDLTDNSITDTVIVTIIDTTIPIVNNPSDLGYDEFSSGNEIVWLITDNYPDTLTIYLDDQFLFSTSWTSGNMIINVDDLGLGVHNYTIVIFDKSFLKSSDTVLVSVVDGTSPIIVNPPADLTYAKNSIGNTISWIPTDFHPDNYIISNDTHQIDSGSWLSGVSITLEIDGLDVGLVNFTITLFDLTSNQFSDTVTVEITAESVFIDKPGNIFYVVNGTGNSLNWTVSDANPDKYIIYKNETIVDSGIWFSGNPISWSIDGLPIGYYNFSISVNDTDSNIITHQLVVTVSDMPIWGILPDDSSYFEGSTGNTIIWNATDMFPGNYLIYKNGSIYDSGGWSNETNININIDGLQVGVYNFTIELRDTVNNTIYDISWITVIDNILPTINSPPDIIYPEGTTGFEINWIGTDIHPSYYEIWNSSNLIKSGTWNTTGENIIYNINGLLKGNYNFTIIIYDTSGNSEVDSVDVNVTDETDPVFLYPTNDLLFSEVTVTGETINWAASDLYNNTYTIFLNGSSVQIGNWVSGENITISLNGLLKGWYEYRIVISDLSGNSIQDIVWVTIIDETDPTFTQIATGLIFNEGDSNQILTWRGFDTYNTTYEIYNDTDLVDSGIWITGNDISINVTGYLKGTHTFTIIIIDGSGNFALDVVSITVNDGTNPTVTSPNNLEFSENGSGPIIQWSAFDNYYSTYEINDDVGLVQSGSWDNSINVTLNLDLLVLTRGVYNYTITLYDISGNSVSDLIRVTVIDTTFPVLINYPVDIQYAEGDIGKTIIWDATDSYAANYEIWNDTNQLINATWTSGVPIVYGIDGLVKGQYNFTIIFIDESNNVINNTVLFLVTDETLPVIDNPVNINYLEGDTDVVNTTITWTVFDNYANYYEIYNGSNLLVNTTWGSGTISLDVSGLSIGVYIFTITIYDLSGNNGTDIVLVQVIEEDSPVITFIPINLYFNEENITGNFLNWTATDIYPGTYTIYNDTNLVDSGIWNDSIEILLSLDGYNKGFYNFTIFIEDSSFNQVSNSVIVSVVDELAPVIDNYGAPVGNRYSSGNTGNTINWTVTENYPDKYSIFINSIEGSLKIWQSGVTIPISIDGLSEGLHNYTIVLFDLTGNSVSHTIIIEVSDFEAPILLNAPSEGEEKDYVEGESLALFLIFIDDNPGNFNITGEKDGIIHFSFPSSSWVSNSLISRQIDGLDKGIYLFTLIVVDTAGNFEIRTFFINVLDKTDPTFINEPFPKTLNYIEGDIGNSRTWSMSDKWAGKWELYQNGSLLNWGDYSSDENNNNWFSNVPEQILLDGFESGIYNITLVILDQSNNSASSSIILTVLDEELPLIILVPSLDSYNETTTGNNLSWNVMDIHAGIYNITLDGEIYDISTWDNIIDININIDGLEAGTYTFVIVFFDLSFNYVNDTVEVKVFDVIKPAINIEQITDEFILGTTNNTIEWDAFDLHPDTYVLLQNGDLIIVGTWDNTESILINIDGRIAGFYNFTIKISDESSNTVIHSVIIRIKDPKIIDTVKPEIVLENSVYEGDVEIFNGIWTNKTGDPISDATIIVQLVFNSEVIQQFGVFTNGNGEYTIKFNYTGLTMGKYSWLLSFEKERYQEWQDITINIEVLPHTYTLEFDVPPTITQGEEYFISVSVYYANNESSSNQISLNELIPIQGPAAGVLVKFTFELELEGEINIISKRVESDNKGIALFKLTKDETIGVISVLSIEVTIIQGETKSSNSLSLVFDSSKLPNIVPGSPDVFTIILNFVEDNVIVIPIAVILVIVSISISVFYSQKSRDKAKQLNRDVKSAFVELKAIKSMQSIIIQNEAKVTVYEEQVSDTEMNINLIGGMVTAFSSFLNELGRSDQSGFEMMEREGISITAHKGKSSIFIVISTEKLPFVMLNQIQRAQQAIESSFRSNFSLRGEVKMLTKRQVHPKFDLASFKAALKYQLSFNGRNIRNLLKEKSLSRALKQNIEYLVELPDTEYMSDSKILLGDIIEFYKSKGITERVSSRTIILAYQYSIFETILEEQ